MSLCLFCNDQHPLTFVRLVCTYHHHYFALYSRAGGQTGQHIFRKLLAKPGYAPIGTVRSEASRQALIEGTAGIGAPADDNSQPIPPESVVVCDITTGEGLDEIIKDCDAVMICTSAKPAPT